MVTGESHYIWGSRLRLRVSERPGCAHVEVDHDRLLLYMPGRSDQEIRPKAPRHWHRAELRRAIPPLITRWEPKIGQSVSHWGIKRMKTNGVSCNRESGRIGVNLELAKKHPACPEYVVAH
jgi:predicted metal-dependent hydrolase